MEGLGELGFWLAVGASLVALIMSGGRKEREKQVTLRRMMELEAEGKLTPQTLAYLREKDAAEEKLERESWGLNMTARQELAFAAAFVVVLIAFLGGLTAFVIPETQGIASIGLMLTIWAAGLVIAWLIWRFSREQKNVTPPGE